MSLRTADGSPCCEITVEALKALVAREFVIGIVRGKNLRRIELTVPPDVAFRALGESSQRIKDLFHSEASVTVIRSFPTAPRHVKAHHRAHCRAFFNGRHVLPEMGGTFVLDPSRLTIRERLNQGAPPLSAPLLKAS